MNFLFAIKLSFDFCTKFEIRLKFVVLSIALARPGTTIFFRRKGNNSYKKSITTYNFRIKSGMCKTSIVNNLEKRHNFVVYLSTLVSYLLCNAKCNEIKSRNSGEHPECILCSQFLNQYSSHHRTCSCPQAPVYSMYDTLHCS